ncbi:MAG: hypothetical protein GY927_23715 [bacterium]|nr:hypothetical protein [bacterium]
MCEVRKTLILGGFALLLSGCIGDASLNNGLSPVLQSESVERGSMRKKKILLALREDAEFGLNREVNWYDVTVAGFNFVDDQCTSYFNQLYKLRRSTNAAKSGINAFDKTTNAILAATGNNVLTISIVAQAFGLASDLVDAYSDTFLYNLPPSETSRFVRELQRAYRNGIAAQQSVITSPAETYHQLQEYLNICLPQTIEARLIERIATTSAATVPTAAGSVDVVVGDQFGLEERTFIVESKHSKTLAQMQRITNPIRSAKKRVILENPSNTSVNTIGDFEPRLSDPRIRAFQRALCVPVDGDMGAVTRGAIVEFFEGANIPRPQIAKNGLMRSDIPRLNEAIAMYPDCSTNTHDSARQLGQLVARG